MTLTSTNRTGIFDTTFGAQGTISSTGPWAPNVAVRATYCHSGNTGNFVGIEGGLWRGNFAHNLSFPGTKLMFEMVEVDDGYSAIDIDVASE